MTEKYWRLLGIEKSTDKTVIRQAYRTQLPRYHPESDPEGFQALREAYDYAMQYADSPEDESLEKEAILLSEEEQKANEICQLYQALLDDPTRCYNINAWHEFVASFYDYPLAIIDIARWQLLDISYHAPYLSLSCVKILADSLGWRQQLLMQQSDNKEPYNDFLNNINSGDSFDYSLLPTTNKTIQNVTIDYIGMAKWIFWERCVFELYYYLNQHTVIYLPDDEKLMFDCSNWFCVANIPNSAFLEYALSCLAEKNLDNVKMIEWKNIVATQYSLLKDKDHSLQYWLDLYNSGHYQEKAIDWLMSWCNKFAPNYLPLLIIAVNQTSCLPVNNTEEPFYAIPLFSPTTISRLAKLEEATFPAFIADFIAWSLSENWNYRQILPFLLLDDGTDRFFRLYRHAIMLRHGNETLLQDIIEDTSTDPLEQFILQNLQRQAKQHLIWLTDLAPVQEFKTWIYDQGDSMSIPQKFIPGTEGNQFFFGRMWLDRLRDLPLVSLMRLYDNIKYDDMEMFDWLVFLMVNKYYDFPLPPHTSSLISQDKKAYWQWYYDCLLMLGLIAEPLKTAICIKKRSINFNLSSNVVIDKLINLIKQTEWETGKQLYDAIDNDSKLIHFILINYPDSIEYYIQNYEKIDFTDIHQKTMEIWQTKLANYNPVYLMLLQMILLNTAKNKEKLILSVKKISKGSSELYKIFKWLNNAGRYPAEYQDKFTQQADKFKKLAQRLANRDGLCDEDELTMLSEFKDDINNNLVLRLCAALLLAKEAQNKNTIDSLSFPKNSIWQFWRWNGRTNKVGVLCQLNLSLIFFGILLGLYHQNLIRYEFYELIVLTLINSVMAIKRRLNDIYNGEPNFFIKQLLYMPLFLFPCWKKTIPHTNRFGPPIEK